MKKQIVFPLMPLIFPIGSLFADYVKFNFVKSKETGAIIKIIVHGYVDKGETIEKSVKGDLEDLYKILIKDGKEHILPCHEEIIENWCLREIDKRPYRFELGVRDKPPKKTSPKKKIEVPDTLSLIVRPMPMPLEVNVSLDTLLLKIISQLPESLKVKHEITTDSTLLKYLSELEKKLKTKEAEQESIPTVKVPSVKVPGLEEKVEKGLFRLDEINNSKIGMLGIYDARNGNDVHGLGGVVDIHIGKELRSNLGLLCIPFFSGEEILRANGSLYKENVGLGFEIVNYYNRDVFVYPYAIGAFNLGPVVISGSFGVGFDSDLELRRLDHFVEGAFDYASNNNNFNSKLLGRSGKDIWGEYSNLFYSEIGIGKNPKLYVGGGLKTTYGVEILEIPLKETFENIEGIVKLMARYNFDSKVGLYLRTEYEGKGTGLDKKYTKKGFDGEVGIVFDFNWFLILNFYL